MNESGKSIERDRFGFCRWWRKGAYEIGVWKYLHETGLDQYVRAVSGTSVGALNAALFVGSSYEVAENLWLNISQDKILSPKEIRQKIL